MSTSPPKLAFFKNLPAPCSKNAKNRHGVYCVVMEKEGSRPRAYTGSSVNDRGYTLRTSQYVNMTGGLPLKVRESNSLGFKRTHIGMLVTLQNPTSARPNEMARLADLNFEDLFTRTFFARTNNSAAFRNDLRDTHPHRFLDDIPGLVHWSSVAWDGLCAHGPIGKYKARVTINDPLPRSSYQQLCRPSSAFGLTDLEKG